MGKKVKLKSELSVADLDYVARNRGSDPQTTANAIGCEVELVKKVLSELPPLPTPKPPQPVYDPEKGVAFMTQAAGEYADKHTGRTDMVAHDEDRVYKPNG